MLFSWIVAILSDNKSMNNIKLHNFQNDLLRKLTLSKEDLRFKDLLIDGLENEHMNYHLQNS